MTEQEYAARLRDLHCAERIMRWTLALVAVAFPVLILIILFTVP